MKTTLLGGVVFGITGRALGFWSPRQTPAPTHAIDALSPRPTAPPSLEQLRKRQSGWTSLNTLLIGPDETCGYISGLSGSAHVCNDPTETCVLVAETLGFVGCCDSKLRCFFQFSCIDYDFMISSSAQCAEFCMEDPLITKCTDSANPYCQTISFPGGIRDHFCGPMNISTPQLAFTTYKGEINETNEREFITSVVTNDIVIDDPEEKSTTSSEISSKSSLKTSKTVPSTTSTNSSSSAVSMPSSSSSTSTSLASTPNAASEKSSTPVGAIIGGVLGGIAVLGLIGLGALWILHRRPSVPSNPQWATIQTDPLNEMPTDTGVYQPFYELPSDDRSQELPSDDPSKYNNSRISGNGRSMVQAYHTLPPHLPQDQQYPGTPQPEIQASGILPSSGEDGAGLRPAWNGT